MYFDRQMAPAQRISDFVDKKASTSLCDSSYPAGLRSADMSDLLPKFISNSLRQALVAFDKKMKGFVSKDALMIGLESRTSSPVRIPRDKDNLQHLQLKNLYPCGEGAGYAGGITSSAMDGINAAQKIACSEE